MASDIKTNSISVVLMKSANWTSKVAKANRPELVFGGKTGIRTLGRLAPTTVFDIKSKELTPIKQGRKYASRHGKRVGVS